MDTQLSGHDGFVAHRQQLMEQANDPGMKKHFQTEVDLVKSWGSSDIRNADRAGSEGDIADGPADASSSCCCDLPASAPGGVGNAPAPGSPTKESAGGNAPVKGVSPGGEANAPAKPAETVPVTGNGTPVQGAGQWDNMITKYGKELPKGLPAVFDLPVQGSDKTLRGIIEDAAEKTGAPAIVLAAQAWQETKAGLYGNQALSEKYGKPGVPIQQGDTLGAKVTTTTGNPGDGQGDTGIVQINPTTFANLIEGKESFGGEGNLALRLPPQPHLKGLDRQNVADAFMIAGSMIKAQADFYKEKGVANSEGEAYMYSSRAYVGGGGSVQPGNPYVNKTGGGDPTYVNKLEDHMADFVNGVTPRWKA